MSGLIDLPSDFCPEMPEDVHSEKVLSLIVFLASSETLGLRLAKT